jgi:chaperonin GroES
VFCIIQLFLAFLKGRLMSDTFKGAIRPLHDRILMKRMENEQKSAGGIYIPDSAQEKTQYGTVVSVGGGRVMDDGSVKPLDLKAGDKIVVGKFSGTEVQVSGQEYLILKEDEVLGVLESD